MFNNKKAEKVVKDYLADKVGIRTTEERLYKACNSKEEYKYYWHKVVFADL